MRRFDGGELRVAFVAGGLSQGGAEKQLVYMVRALQRRGVNVRCYCLTQGEFYEDALRQLGVPPIWLGGIGSPAVRLIRLSAMLRTFRPDVVQAGHFFANLYAALGARACGAISVGSIRNDGEFELRENKGWGPLLLRLPSILIANSQAGARFAGARLGSLDRVAVVPNVIDLAQFDAVRSDLDLKAGRPGPLAIAVGRLVSAKRFDNFLQALATARHVVPNLHAVVVGDGPERAELERLASTSGQSEAVRFVGRRADVPALLRQADFLVSSSEHEGFPNVLLEAMAAGLAVVTTPAGDAASVALPGVTGYVVPIDDVKALAEQISKLASDPARCRTMGRAGRKRVELLYQDGALADAMLTVYSSAAQRQRGRRIARFDPPRTPLSDDPVRISSR